MTDYWLYSKLKGATGEQIFEVAEAYEIDYTTCGHTKLNLTLDATALLTKENQDDMATVILNDIMREQSREIDVKKLIKTVHINEKKKIVTVILTNGNKGISRCTDPDIFDPYVGFSVALTYALFPSRTSAVKFVDKCVDKNEAKAEAKAKASAKKQAKKGKANE